MKLEDLVLETALHYNLDNRSMTKVPGRAFPASCAYVDRASGNCCAVGRCLTKAGLSKFSENHNTAPVNNMLGYMSTDEFDNCFKEEYRGFETSDWSNLQDLHDCGDHWDNNGISKVGLRFISKVFGKHVATNVRKHLKKREKAIN